MHLLGAVLGGPGDRWILAFAVSALVVVVAASLARSSARGADPGDEPHRGVRRRAGALLAVGPAVGLLVDPGAGDHVVLVAAGAVGLAVLGAAVERRRDQDRLVLLVAAVAAAVAVAAGVRFGPTGVAALDVLFGVAVVGGVTVAFDGLGNSDGLVPGLGALAALGLLALGAFGDQVGVANAAGGLLGASIAFLALCLPPASLFPGRAGRLATGFVLGVLVCSVDTVPGPPGPLVAGSLLVAVPLLDLVVVGYDRARRRRPLAVDRRDHLVHRVAAYGASTAEAVAVLVLVQLPLVLLAVLAGRGVVGLAVAAIVGVFVVGALGGYALRAPTERLAPVGLSNRAKVVVGAVVVVLVLGIVPLALDVPDVTDTMQKGRHAAERALQAARRGDAAEAQVQFRRAAGHFDEARDRLRSPRYQAARLVPGLAPNLRASRALADVGHDLARNGEIVTAAVVPEALQVVDGRVPVEEVERVAPALARGAATLERALARLRDLRDEPYLLRPVRTAVADVRAELRRAAREARNTATAARLAPAILGAEGERRYLVVVQNPAENRGTGGLIGAYGVLTANDGAIQVSPLRRAGEWNAAVRAAGRPPYDAPDDYRRRYAQFLPETNLQAVNLSPDFPTVGRVLASLAPAAGVGEVDGVLAVDPEGLAALLRLTGPVLVPGWPVDVSADNVVDVTLKDAYEAFAATPERAEFLGDVAQAALDAATTGSLGDPATIASVLGDAARRGHLALWFARPEEERLARAVHAAGALRRAGDSLHVTVANLAANKLDAYLERTLDYRVEVRPDERGRGATATGSLVVRLENDAPAGLPPIVAGPYEGAPPGTVVEGENVSYVSVYTPLRAVATTLDGVPTPVIAGRELGLDVYSTVVRTLAGEGHTLAFDLEGRLRTGRDGWYVLEVNAQPMVEPGRARISVSVPDGYRIVAVRGLQRVQGERATGLLPLDGPSTVRVRIARDPDSLWSRLEGR